MIIFNSDFFVQNVVKPLDKVDTFFFLYNFKVKKVHLFILRIYRKLFLRLYC